MKYCIYTVLHYILQKNERLLYSICNTIITTISTLLQYSFYFENNMNLFILSLIQREIAQYMMDKHVSKILLEAVQMLCSAKRILDPDDTEVNDRLYKMAHKNHPVTIWCRKSRANFIWSLDLVEELHRDYRDLT